MPVVTNRTLSDDEVQIGAKQETKTKAAGDHRDRASKCLGVLRGASAVCASAG
jgi:hypothetical protein